MHSPETSKVWRMPHHKLELLRAHYRTQAFPRHTHERYAVGVIERGALGFYYRGENVVAAAGQINLCIPGEAHSGQAATAEGWTYRMFYIDTQVFIQIASDITQKPCSLPFFQTGVVADIALAQQLRQLHVHLEKADVSLLAQETALLTLLAQLVKRHADGFFPARRTGQETLAVRQVKQYLNQHYADAISLTDLVTLTGLSRYHLVRTFRDAVGVPPHAYLRQLRVRRAKEHLAAGCSIAEAAVNTGFNDQSHLTRWFKRLWGVTPGQYRNNVQDIRCKL